MGETFARLRTPRALYPLFLAYVRLLSPRGRRFRGDHVLCRLCILVSPACVLLRVPTTTPQPTPSHFIFTGPLFDMEAASHLHSLRHATQAVALMHRTNLAVCISVAMDWHQPNTNRIADEMHSACHFDGAELLKSKLGLLYYALSAWCCLGYLGPCEVYGTTIENASTIIDNTINDVPAASHLQKHVACRSRKSNLHVPSKFSVLS
jgi:hypothetical protein